MSEDEEQFNPKIHKHLLQAISSLSKTQHIRKSTRNEPQSQQDEFQLVKGATAVVNSDRGTPNAIGIGDIVQILKTTKKHVNTGKQLRNVQSTKKVLEKPLEKSAANRIKRTIGYEGVKKKLVRWDAVVTKHRSAETQLFPLPTETVYVDTSTSKAQLQNKRIKSDLALDLDATDAKLKELKKARLGIDKDDEFRQQQREDEMMKKKLTRDELYARRKELAYLKMRESQKSAKARMQNKIKSKKYHKLMKRQKMLEQMKAFEILKKTNPEAALEKLNELENNRVLERANLRHKNTGVWAKNLQVRAKYDKDVRKDLAEQLDISRQLTEKKIDSDHEEADEETEFKINIAESEEAQANGDDNDPFNPWTKTKTKQTAADKASNEPNWRKYWVERNENEKKLKKYHAVESEAVSNSDCEGATLNVYVQKVKSKTLKKQKAKSRPNKNVKIENGWKVEELDSLSTRNIDDIFDAQEDEIRNKLSAKLQHLSSKVEHLKIKKATTAKPLGKKQKDELKNLKDLSFKKQTLMPDIDEELNYDESNTVQTIRPINNKVENLAAPPTSSENKDSLSVESATASASIDPNKFAAVKLKHNHLNVFNALCDENLDSVDFAEEEEYDDATDHQMTISQAFEDDDIIADFSKEKVKDAEIKNAEIQLAMPGWGAWAGAGIVDDGKKSKRLLLKLAPEEKRRDENKDGVYINEETSKHLRAHMVSDVPFPFTTLKDFEASIRAPIGRNSVPETAFRMLTRPSVITRKGQVIEPMDESDLVKPERKLLNIVDKRIKHVSKAKTQFV